MRQALATMAVALMPALALAQTAPQPVLVGTHYTVNASAGSQTDPHVSGEWVAYTSEFGGDSEIRYHFLPTSADQAIPRNAGDYDFLSDISGTRVVFTRATGSTSNIHLFDVATSSGQALDPAPNAYRQGAAIGGDTVAWVDRALTPSFAASEIVARDLVTGISTRLTDDLLLDHAPAVSPDGNAIVWTKCQTNLSGCSVHKAMRTGGTWQTAQLPTPAGTDAQFAETDGTLVVYEATTVVNGIPETDLTWQPLAGGPGSRLQLAGDQRNPAVAGGLIAFESRTSPASTNYDILLYDTRTSLLYQVTNSPDSEMLSDIYVAPDGLVRVVYVRSAAFDNNVYAYTFRVHEPAGGGDDCEDVDPIALCESPGTAPLLAQLQIVRTNGAPDTAVTSFSASTHYGVLCVDNGVPTGSEATAGWVAVNGAVTVGPAFFQKKNAATARFVALSNANALDVSIAGGKGTSFDARVYAVDREVCGLPNAGSGESQIIQGDLLQPIELDPLNDPVTGGCTSTGAGAASLALLGLIAVLRRRAE